jgi:cytochrome c peroxidase
MQYPFLLSAAAVLLLFTASVAAGDVSGSAAPISLPHPLRSIAIPEPVHIEQYVANKPAAVRLGKALFWDMQVGSDGIQACGSCHFHAGADARTKNQLNPDLNGNNPSFTPPEGPNCVMTAGDFPFHRLANPDDPTSVVADRHDVCASQGVFHSIFIDVIPGSAVEQVLPVADPVFNVDGVQTRRVEPRNAPTVINAIFNHRNFWDGRAQSEFNGVNPFGSRDPSARVLLVNTGSGMPRPVETGITAGASLASLACGPAVSPFEMSAEGRTLRKLGKKLLALRPLARQLVDPKDSVLGPLSRHGKKGGDTTGLETTYAQMIQAAFRPVWWQSDVVVTYDAAGNPTFTPPGGGKGKVTGTDPVGSAAATPGSIPGLTTDQYSVMEVNFSLFFGLSIQLYLETLVSDQTPFDQYLGGRKNALTPQQEAGLRLFFGKAGCARCHVGTELTEASYSQCLGERIDALTSLSGRDAKYDKGFVNTGVRTAAEDRGIGGSDPFGRPLSDARRLKLGLLPPGLYNLAVRPGDPIAVEGAFKIPGLRNVELTAPYFHNGGMATLEQVVDFYNRGGDFSLQDRDNVRDFMQPLGLTADGKAALVAFLKSLTDERVRYEQAPFDHPQIFIPNGHPTVGGRLVPGDDGHAADDLIEIPAVGADGGAALQPVF